MKSIFKKITLILIILTTILNSLLVSIFIYYWNKNEISNLNALYPKSNIKIYDKDKNMIANLSETYQSYTPFEEIPPVIINATLAIEDSRFFEHNGLDYEALARSIITNIKHKAFVEGASTITQQLIKNIYLSNEKTIERKINEAILSLKLEKILNKEDVISSYLSNVLFGGRIYGINMAAKYYFDKELSEITLKEASLLAGLLQLPNYYNPFINYEAALLRRNLVLKRMYELNYITFDEYQNTLKIELNSYLKKGKINEDIGIYASYIDFVINDLSTTNNINFNNSDIQIEINVDSNIQNFVYEIMKNKYNNFNDDKLKCGIIVLDNNTGTISAIGGSREDGLKNLNYATDVRNQPASTIKPILSYAPAIEYLNYVPLTQILDEPYYYSSGQQIHNWDNRYLGNISLRFALANSRNVPAIKLFKFLGEERAWDFATKIGIKNYENYSYDAMAIGGFNKGYTVLEMANAYMSFANMGKYKRASAINKITIDMVEEKLNNDFKQVFLPSTAFLINDILHDVLKGTSYDLKHTFLSSKTGQSNYDEATRKKYNIPYNSTKDSWAIGYTKDMTVAVWCGYDQISPNYYLTPSTKNIPIDIMSMILKKFAKNDLYYEMPNNLFISNVDIINGLIYEGSPGLYRDYFYKGFVPLGKDNLDYDRI